MRWVLFAISVFSFAAVIPWAAQSDGLPAGEGRDIVLRMCANCHGLDRVTSARYPKKHWEDVVYDMVSRGAEGSDDEVSSAEEIEDGLSFPAAESQLIVRYRTEKGPFKTYQDLLKVPGLDAKLLDEQKKNILF
jgi:hypothetical protein